MIMSSKMEKITCAVILLAVITLNPKVASAKFAGNLRSDVAWTVDITPSVANTGPTALGVTFVDTRDRQSIDIFTINRDDQTFVPYNGVMIPRGTRRIIIEFDFPESGVGAQLRITQGTTVISLDA